MTVHRDLTVAKVRTPEGADHVEVLFLESARIYRLATARADIDQVLARLHEGGTVRVILASWDTDVVADVQEPR